MKIQKYNDAAQLKCSSLMTAEQLNHAGITGNRVKLPGDHDYCGVVIITQTPA